MEQDQERCDRCGYLRIEPNPWCTGHPEKLDLSEDHAISQFLDEGNPNGQEA